MNGTLRFVRYLAAQSGLRFAFALTLLVLGGLTEGVSILLVIPLLSLAEEGAPAGMPMPDWAPDGLTIGLGAALMGLVALIALHGVFTRAKNIYLADLLFDLLNSDRNCFILWIFNTFYNILGRFCSFYCTCSHKCFILN